MRDELGRIMAEIVALRPKTYSYLIDNNDENKKAKDTKKMCHKKKEILYLKIINIVQKPLNAKVR